MAMVKITIFFFLIFGNRQWYLRAENKNEEYQIDFKYVAGKYLIYDCKNKHYACVDIASFIACKNNRQESIDNKSPEYPCAPLSKFEDKTTCVKKNYKIMDIGAAKRFCYR